MTAQQTPTFGISIAAIFRSGIVGFAKNPVSLGLASLATIAVYATFRIPAQVALNDGLVVRSMAFDLVGLVLAGVVAFPWYRYSLDVADGNPVDLRAPFQSLWWIKPQLIASIFFWAGVLLGLRYLFGLPSILVAILYAFYGFVLAEGRTKSGLTALGRSVALGEGKRIGLLAVAMLFLLFNMFGAISLGFGEVNTMTIGLAVAGLVVTTSMTMVGGAVVYRTLQQLKGAK